ncbi:MAG: ABC transporter permease [Nitrososphaerales archaeon]
MSIQKELNATVTICARDVLRFIRDWKNNLLFSFFFPIAFLGILGGTIGQNMSGGLGYNYMQFALLGMVANLLVQFTMMGVTSLIEERENGFTQEIFVSPVSKYSILFGKIIGGSLTSLVSLLALFIVAFAMGIPLSLEGIGRILLVTPVLFLLGGSVGVLLSGIFGSSPKAVDRATIMVMFPQMFLSGALIPVKNSTGVLSILVHLMPATYLVDLLRGIFYQGTSVYGKIVLYNPLVDLTVSIILSVIFLVSGSFLFVRGERNR